MGGRFVVWTSDAFAKLDAIYGTAGSAALKKDYVLPRVHGERRPRAPHQQRRDPVRRPRRRGGHAAAEGAQEEPAEEPRGDAGPEPLPAGRARQRDEGAEDEEAQVREAGQGAAGGVDGVLQRGAPRGRGDLVKER